MTTGRADMLAETVIKRLANLPEISKAGKKANGLFRLLECPALWERAYDRIARNKGALTPGVDGETFDGFSLEKSRALLDRLMDGSYRTKPVRRREIPKANGKTRPLGIPTVEDRLVQEVVRMILEAIYEPVFSKHSHGFRPERSCHTTLEEIQATWNGVKWLVEVDVSSYFDTIDHDVLLELLGRKIADKRFLRLIRGMIKAGYVKDWTYHCTYSGTPQGGVASPLLANIYLHELDRYMEEQMNTFNKGDERTVNREYKRVAARVHRLRRKIDRIRTQAGADASATSDLLAEVDRLGQEQRRLPYGDPLDPNYRRLLYKRYADDFLIGVIGSKEDAREIMSKVRHFLTETLKLTVSEEKSGIRHASDGARFLGYEVCTYTDQNYLSCGMHGGRRVTRRNLNGQLQLGVPRDHVAKFCERMGYGNLAPAWSVHRPQLLQSSDAEIVLTYNAELRGFATYYALSGGVKTALRTLYYVWRGSLLKTLAGKHQNTVAGELRRLRQGPRLAISYQDNGKTRAIDVWRLADLKRHPVKYGGMDNIPNTRKFTGSRTEIIERLHARECEYCGKTNIPCQVHHVRKMKDMKGSPLWLWLKAARTRKRVVLCQPCHKDLHMGRLPDLRYQQQKGVESRVQ